MKYAAPSFKIISIMYHYCLRKTTKFRKEVRYNQLL